MPANYKCSVLKWAVLIFLFSPRVSVAQNRYRVSLKNKALEISSRGKTYSFSGRFTIIYTSAKPMLALRPGGIQNVPYNVPTWVAYKGKQANLTQTKTDASVAGDGFDDKILKGDQKNRTPEVYNAGQEIDMSPSGVKQIADTLFFTYAENEVCALSSKLILRATKYPLIRFTLTPKKAGYFSTGYAGAPEFDPAKLAEIWQPLIWQEKRFPDKAYLTPAHLCTLPTTFINDGVNTLGVLAAPQYIPFDPLPLLDNSQFAISLRDKYGMAKNMVFAPLLGGLGSQMEAGKKFSFEMYLVVEPQSITYTYEKIAREYFGFKDYRKNDISTLNKTLDNIAAYSLSHYTWFVDSLKGFAYATDVPGAVKNVSSLNPLELSIVMDNKAMFEKRAYPLMEYMLSREKFLFSLDSTQKIQSPSRKMAGPVAPVSELVSLYNIYKKAGPVFKALAVKEYNSSRARNLEDFEQGNNWINAMNLFKATGDKAYLDAAVKGADRYLNSRVAIKQTEFADPFSGSFFFWPSFTDKWVELMGLYELTGSKRYLDAAHDGARHYAMFTWAVPRIPDSMILVNKGGKAPFYSYLKSKGHKQMYLPEENAPAWRLSEIGLTPESSGTSVSHRGIFMTNFAPWMLKLGYYTHDEYLKEIAKAAVIGRYRNFPGYHINTARTTAYEKEDFPLHEHKDQSVSSFHYNHIMPMASMLLDYLVTDAFVRSDGKINFPAEFIEGYAYLQSNFYGSKKGNFYADKDVQLWMPAKLLSTSSIELNYISGRKDNTIYLAFMNQSAVKVSSTIALNDSLTRILAGGAKLYFYRQGAWKPAKMQKNIFAVSVSPKGIAAVKIMNVKPQVQFQDKIMAAVSPVKNDAVDIDPGNAKAMLFKLGAYSSRVYVYLKDDDTKLSEARLTYTVPGEKDGKTITKKNYPYEFTIDMPAGANSISLQLEVWDKAGKSIKGNKVLLGDVN